MYAANLLWLPKRNGADSTTNDGFRTSISSSI
jgi:hypothetical protein